MRIWSSLWNWSKACDLLERLGYEFCSESLDYEHCEGERHFLVYWNGAWRAATIADAEFSARSAKDMATEIVRTWVLAMQVRPRYPAGERFLPRDRVPSFE
jgi:hypothetical protein